MKKKATLGGWTVENASRLSRGADPTWITRFILTRISRFTQYVEVQEFHNSFTVGIEERRINGLTCREADSFLAWVGAPTFDAIWQLMEGVTEAEMDVMIAEGDDPMDREVTL